jgi:radical SAM superfamily enzyme YgiQ (UPF0313 family)
MAESLSAMLVNLCAPAYPVRSLPTALVTLGASARSALGRRLRLTYFDRQIDDLDALKRIAGHERPRLIGLSAQFGTRNDLDRALSAIRTVAPETAVVVGNVTGTYAPAAILADHPDVVCCVGRGEETLVRMLENLSMGDDWASPRTVPNAMFMCGQEIVRTSSHAVPQELVCSGDWSGYFAAYAPCLYDEVWVEASRGCPQKRGGVGCMYCAILPDAGSRDWSPRPMDIVARDLREVAEWGVRHLRFADEEFMAHRPAHAIEFCSVVGDVWRELRDAGTPPPTFDVAMRVDDVVRTHPGQSRARRMEVEGRVVEISPNALRHHALERLKSLGLRQIYLGVESGSAAQLKRMRKAATPEGNELAIATLRGLGIQAACGWIMFDPFMKGSSDLLDNCAFIERNQLLPRRLSDDFVTNPINRMRVLAGTPLLEQVEAAGLVRGIQPNGVEFDFRYADARVADVVAALEEWELALDRSQLYEWKNGVAHRALSAEEETRRSHMFFQLKKLDFSACRALVEQLAETETGRQSSRSFAVPVALRDQRSQIIAAA